MTTRVHIENFPVELWLEIFRYLTSEHIAVAFRNLNSYFDFLLSSPQLPIIFRIKINQNHVFANSQAFERLNPMKLQWIQALDTISSLHSGYTIQFLRYHASCLISLRSVNLHIRAKQAALKLSYLCEALPQLHMLKMFRLKCIGRFVDKTFSTSIGILFKTLFQHPKLRHCTLSLWNLQETNFDRQCILDLPSNHSIEYLCIDNIDSRIFFDIISCCHALKSLSSQRNNPEDIFYQSPSSHPNKSLSLHALSIVKLSLFGLKFEELERICASTNRQLRQLEVDYSVYVFTNHYEDYLEYFNRTRWTKLIEDIKIVNVNIKIHALDEVATDIISNMVKMDPWFKWTENQSSSSYAALTITKAN
ncbi:hypothetical protein I4U23_013012 [Adineta vaga]|nr:hypothetical protein I4U23_013012 [Adineta vaga]